MRLAAYQCGKALPFRNTLAKIFEAMPEFTGFEGIASRIYQTRCRCGRAAPHWGAASRRCDE